MIDPKDIATILCSGPIQIPLAIKRGHLLPATLLKVTDQRRLIEICAVIDAATLRTWPGSFAGCQSEDLQRVQYTHAITDNRISGIITNNTIIFVVVLVVVYAVFVVIIVVFYFNTILIVVLVIIAVLIFVGIFAAYGAIFLGSPDTFSHIFFLFKR